MMTTIEEAAEVLGSSPASIKREWRIGRDRLFQEMSAQ